MAKRLTDEAREAEIRRAIGEAVRDARYRAGLTQGQLQARLAEALGVDAVSPTLISRVERGTQAPSLGALDALCEILGQGEGSLLRSIREALRPKNG